MHEVGLAEADTAVDEQGVVGAPGILSDLQRSGAAELIRFALDEGLEGEVAVEVVLDRRQMTLAGLPRGLVRRSLGGRDRGRDGASAAHLAAHLELHLVRSLGVQALQDFVDARQEVRAYPVDDEAIGGKQLQHVLVQLRLEGANPGVELLLGEFTLELRQAAVPDCSAQDNHLCDHAPTPPALRLSSRTRTPAARSA